MSKLFWICQGVSVSFGGLLALAGFPNGDYGPPLVVSGIMSLCLLALLLFDK